MAILPGLKKGADPGASSDPVREIKERLIANFMAHTEEAHTLGAPSLGKIMADMANAIENDGGREDAYSTCSSLSNILTRPRPISDIVSDQSKPATVVCRACATNSRRPRVSQLRLGRPSSVIGRNEDTRVFPDCTHSLCPQPLIAPAQEARFARTQ